MKKLINHVCICTKCKINSRDKIFVASGKKTQFVLQNDSTKVIDQYIVDDCLLNENQKEEKCDYLFNLKNEKIAYLIECKGSDILKAVNQLNSTLNILKNNFNGYTLKGKIVPSKVYSPDLITVSYKKLRERLNGNLETKNILCTEII